MLSYTTQVKHSLFDILSLYRFLVTRHDVPKSAFLFALLVVLGVGIHLIAGCCPCEMQSANGRSLSHSLTCYHSHSFRHIYYTSPRLHIELLPSVLHHTTSLDYQSIHP
jgi:hypothetical protein